MLKFQTVPDSTNLCPIKGPKSKFPGGACPQTPPHLGKKLKENLTEDVADAAYSDCVSLKRNYFMRKTPNLANKLF